MHLCDTTVKYRSEVYPVVVTSMLWVRSGQALEVQLPVQGLTELLASLHNLHTSVLSVQGHQQLQQCCTAWLGSSSAFKRTVQQKPVPASSAPEQLKEHSQQQPRLILQHIQHCNRLDTCLRRSLQQANTLLTAPRQHRQHNSQRSLPGPLHIRSAAFSTSAALGQDAAATAAAAVQQKSKASSSKPAVQQAPSAPGTPPRPSSPRQQQQQLGRQLAARHLRQYLQSINTSGFVEGLAQGIRAGDRLAISRSLTLCESTRPDHSLQAAALLRKLIDDNNDHQHHSLQQNQLYNLPPLPPLVQQQQQQGSGPPPAQQHQQHQQQGAVPQPPATAGPALTQATATAALTAAPSLPSNSPSSANNSSSSSVALRIGLSGPPGAGKSSLIETWGCYLADQGSKVAVLAVDPSSMESGGAILGDKTRMSRLSSHANAYVRPSPARGTLGGVSRATFDAMLICEAAGYDRILVETVGVGQSEVAVADLVDCMMLVMPPVGGDDLQMIKRGIMEVADVVAVNKADGETEKAASRAASEYSGCLHLMPHRYRAWEPQALPVSAHTGKGVPALARLISQFQQALTDSGELQRCRVQRAESVAWLSLEEQLLEGLRQDPHVRWLLGRLLPMVRAGTMAPRSAADIALAYFYQHCG